MDERFHLTKGSFPMHHEDVIFHRPEKLISDAAPQDGEEVNFLKCPRKEGLFPVHFIGP
jgi:hypothetical protein